MHTPIELLKQFWQHNSFREPQEQIINSVLAANNTVALLPTGGGKSICFQIPALLMPGVCLVISPLIALIEDQVNNLRKKGIKAAAIIGGTSLEDIDAVFDNCLYGNYKFLYLSPEKLQQTWILERIVKLKINLIAVDEAHCISQWGHDFRPAYLEIGKVKNLFPNIPVIALTASANQRVLEDICLHLNLDNPHIFKKSFFRENIVYGVYKVENIALTIERMLLKNPFPTIIYARNRKETQLFAQKLNSINFKASFFHGGLSVSEKKKRLQDWLEEKTPIIVATNAFGMGIDKPNVKNVIHIRIPENLENYYQEAGRAGRNNQKAFASILISPNELESATNWINSNLFDKSFLKKVYQKLNNFLNIAQGEGYNTTYSFNFNKFCLHNQFSYRQAYNALQFLDRQGIVKLSQNAANRSKLLFTALSGELLDVVYDNEKHENILLFILRNYPNIHEFDTPIDLEFISSQTDESVSYIIDCIQHWQSLDLCRFTPEENDITVTFNEPWEGDRTLSRILPYLEQQNNLKINQYKSMLFYIENEDICKNKILLRYFDEIREEDCGICSACLSKNKNIQSAKDNIKEITEKILHYLTQNPASITELETSGLSSKENIIIGIQILLEDGKIIANFKNQYTIK